jgi:hypothetical protein
MAPTGHRKEPMSMNLPPPPPGSNPDQAWTPPPAPAPTPDPQLRLTGNDAPPPEHGSPVVTSSRSNLTPLLVLLVAFGAVAVVAVAVWLGLRSRDDQSVTTTTSVSQADITSPAVVSSLAGITVPPVSIPQVTAPAELTVPATVSRELTSTVAPTVAPTPAPEAVDLFTGTQAGAMVADVAAARGADPLRILEVVIYPTYAFAQVQDPTEPTYVDRFPWRDGEVGASEPVRLFGDGDLETNLFPSTEVAWDAIPSAIATAVEQAAIPGGEVTHVIVSRDLPFKPDVVIRVYVSSDRESGYVELDAQGGFLEVVR